jgi:hypothetical protein
MKVAGFAAGVRPQADVGLLGLEEPIDDDRALAKQRALLVCFLGSQTPRRA